MVSIIVSSYDKDLFFKFENSLKSSIGVPYQLIKIDNPNKYSLSKAYNLGAEEARFDILVFVHEDVVFATENWGMILCQLFEQNEKLGIVGVAGSLKKSCLPTGWGTGTAKYDRINLIQANEAHEEIHSTRKGNQSFEPVKVLDGVFLATTKKIWETLRFDESLLGFHVYDIDFSLRVTQSYLGLITYEILLKHFSMGNYNSSWVEKTLAYHKRKDKALLFDREKSFDSNIRRAWFKALTSGSIENAHRQEYLKEMGFDLLSAIHAFSFRFPAIGRKIFKCLSLFGL